MRITSKGQVTIPQEIREKMGFLPETEVEFLMERGAVRLVRAGSRRGQRAIRGLRGTARGVSMTTDEIMALTRGED